MKLIQSVIMLTILILSCTDSVVDDDTNDDPNWEYYSFKCTPDLKFEVNTTFPYGSDVKFTERLEGVFSIRMNYRYSYTTMAGNDTTLYKEIYTRTNTVCNWGRSFLIALINFYVKLFNILFSFIRHARY